MAAAVKVLARPWGYCMELLTQVLPAETKVTVTEVLHSRR
jgi:hypothetical protein